MLGEAVKQFFPSERSGCPEPSLFLQIIPGQADRRLTEHARGRAVAWVTVSSHSGMEALAGIGWVLGEKPQVEKTSGLDFRGGPLSGRWHSLGEKTPDRRDRKSVV